MTDGDGLLRAILQSPADDVLRLVYADWLDGLDTASIVCTNCNGERSRTFAAPPTDRDKWDVAHGSYSIPHEGSSLPRLYTCRVCDMRGRWPDLHHQNRAAHIRWAIANPQNSMVCLCGCADRSPNPCETCRLFGAEIAAIPRRTDGETHYVANRGFVSEVRLSCNDFLTHATALFAAHPITRVQLIDKRPCPDSPDSEGPLRGTGVSYDWWRNNGTNAYEDLPSALFEVLAGLYPERVIKNSRFTENVFESASASDGLDALSRACVAIGRARAALDPL